MTITLTREEAQQVLDALEGVKDMAWDSDTVAGRKLIETLRAKLSEPKNEFNPDWNAMAVMVEEQQRMAKQIEELDIALAEQDAKYLDAVETLDDEGWTWDGDQWQRPATRSEKLREARITRRPRGWSKEDEPEPVAWTVGGLITDFSRDFSAYKTKTYTRPLYTAPPQREWQGLTDEEMFDCLAQTDGEAKRLPLGFKWFAEAIEAKLKEKNT